MSRDEGGLSALQIAAVAGVLLVVVVGADVALNRAVSLDVETDDGWQTVGQLPTERGSYAERGNLVEVNRSEEVTFRLSVDNQRLDAFQGDYEVRHDGERVAQGSLSADRLGVAEDRFTIPGGTLLSAPPSEGQDRPRPIGVNLELTVDGETAHAWLDVREVAR